MSVAVTVALGPLAIGTSTRRIHAIVVAAVIWESPVAGVTECMVVEEIFAILMSVVHFSII